MTRGAVFMVLLGACGGSSGDGVPGFYALLEGVKAQPPMGPSDASRARLGDRWYFIGGNGTLCFVSDTEAGCGGEATHVGAFNGTLFVTRLAGIFASTDGQTFTALPGSPARASSIIGASDALLVFVPGGVVWRSTTGMTFEKLADVPADTDSGGVKNTSRFVRSATGGVFLVRASSDVQGITFDQYTAWEYAAGALKDAGGDDRSFVSIDGVPGLVGDGSRFAYVSYPLRKILGNDRWYHPFDTGLHFATSFTKGTTSNFTTVFVNSVSINGNGPLRAEPFGFDERGRLWLLSGAAFFHTREALDPTHDAASRAAIQKGKGCDTLVSMLGFATEGVDPEPLTLTSSSGTPIRFWNQVGTDGFESRTYVYSPAATLMVGLRPNEPYFVTDYDGVCLAAGRHAKGEKATTVP